MNPSGTALLTLDDVAAALARRLQESMPEGGLYGRIALGRLPEPVEHILLAALERRVAREAALPETEWVDADDAGLREAGRAWREAAREAARYPPEAWPTALAEAAGQALRHLVDPAGIGAAFCFAGEDGPLPVAAIRARLAVFGPYPYLREILARYAERKGLERLDRAGLESLLRRVDRRMTSTFGAGEWSALAAPLFGLVGGLPGQNGRVPADVLRRFFQARSHDALAAAMGERETWSPSELHDALVTTLAGRPAAAQEETVDLALEAASDAPAGPPATAPPPALWQTLGGVEPDRPAPEAGGPAGPEPLWKTLARAPAEPPPAADTQPAVPSPQRETLASLEARVLGDGAIADRDRFVAEVAGSEAAYRSLLEDLDRSPTWEAAWPAIARAFQENGVDIYGETAIAFTDAVQARFAGE